MSGIIDLDGTQKSTENQIEKVLVDDNTYDGTIDGVLLLPSKDFETGKDVERIVINVKIAKGTISGWYNPKVSKGAGKYSPSKLYSLLDKAKLIEDLRQFVEQIGDDTTKLTNYVKAKLVGKQVIVLTKTVTSNDGTKYSKVDKIVNFK